MSKDIVKKVAVAMSGGVDSSVSAALLKEQGYEPTGVSFRFTEKSLEIAVRVCEKLGIPHELVDYRDEFKEKVIGYFVSSLKNKITPNPCVICNHLVKFERLFRFADERDIPYVATGHYARIVKSEQTGKYELLRAADKSKDQSYFLCLLGQKDLARIIFPLGEYSKKTTYEIAKTKHLDFFKVEKQSQDLCFIGRGQASEFIKREIGLESGEIVDAKGRVLGRHKGLYFYTVGQRKNTGLSNGPWWVVKLDREKNQLVVTNQEDDPAFYQKTVALDQVNFISGEAPKEPLSVEAKTRYAQPLAKAILRGSALEFEEPQRAVTPGQWAVFYQGEVCLGGGIIL